MLRVDTWSEFFEKQARSAEASRSAFAGDDYELEEYWRFQAHDFRAIAAWLRENASWLPSLPERVSL
jgi:hypothetical protein